MQGPVTLSEMKSKKQRGAHIPGLLFPEKIQPAGSRLQRNQPLLLPPTAESQRSESCWQQKVILEGLVLVKGKIPFIKLISKSLYHQEEAASNKNKCNACCPSIFRFFQIVCQHKALPHTMISDQCKMGRRWSVFLLYLNCSLFGQLDNYFTSLLRRVFAWEQSAYSINRKMLTETFWEDSCPPVSNTLGLRKFYIARPEPGDDNETASHKWTLSRFT